MTENTQIFIEFNVEKFFIKNVSKTPIPCSNKNYIFAHFKFSQEWDNVEKTAVFTKDDIVCHIPIVDNKCAIPNELMLIAGIIEVSVFGGDRITTGNTILKVVESGFHDESEPPVPLDPTSVWVKSPDGSVSLVREVDGVFQYFDGNEWKNIISGDGFDMEVIQSSVSEAVENHNISEESHPDIRNAITSIETQIQKNCEFMVISEPTTFYIPQDFPDLYEAFEHLTNCLIKSDVTIQLADGTYELDRHLVPPTLLNAYVNSRVIITGNSTDKSKVILKSTSADGYIWAQQIGTYYQFINLTFDGDNRVTYVIRLDKGHYSVYNCEIKNGSMHGLAGYFGAVIYVNTVVFTNCMNGIYSSYHNFMYLTGPITITGCTNGIRATGQSTIQVTTGDINISNCSTALYADFGSLMRIPSGSIKMSGSITSAAYASDGSYIYVLGGTTVGTFSPSVNTVGNYNSYIRR